MGLKKKQELEQRDLCEQQLENKRKQEKEQQQQLVKKRQQETKEKLRQEKINQYQQEIKEIESFLVEDCEFPLEKSKLYAESFVLECDCVSLDKLRLQFIRGSLTTTFNTMKMTSSEQEKISQALFSTHQATTVKKKSQIMPIMDGTCEPEPVVLTDCFLTHDWGMDENNRSNHNRVAKVNQFLKNKGLITWFDEDRMEGNVRRKMTEGIDNTLCMVVFITDRYRNKVNGTEDRDNCRYEFTYGVEQKGPQRMVPVVMEERMLNAREWRQELGAALGTKLYVNMVSDNEEEFNARCMELYQRIVSVIGQSRKERGEGNSN
jgi:hypothetical protein